MEKNFIRTIKAAATKLKNSKMEKLDGAEITALLDSITSNLDLNDKGEAILFAAIFDMTCNGNDRDICDMARYFDCSQLDIMEYVPKLKNLQKKGYIIQTDLNECRLNEQRFKVTDYVMGCIADNRRPDTSELPEMEKHFDRYDFCKLVDTRIHSNDNSAVLFQFVLSLEKANTDLEFVKEVQKTVADIEARTLFYEICYDFVSGKGESPTCITRTLEDIYETYSKRFSEKRALTDDSHILLKTGLIEADCEEDSIELSNKGKRLFLAGDYGMVGENRTKLNLYSFPKEVDEYVYEKHNAENLMAMDRLNRWTKRTEEDNRHIASLSKIRELIPEEDIRILFYLICHECINGNSAYVTRILNRLYPARERNVAMKAIKEKRHRLQSLDLVETVTESSLFGERTSLQLTDKGKELYFEKDAQYFIDEAFISRKNTIRAADIKEKRLFFTEQEQRQLSMVGDSLMEDNYCRLIDRLEAKGLPKGIAILLYGAPGTGKTESVMQWARKTGRDIVHVDISAAKSMWYGESEKIVKGIFEGYKKACRSSSIKPILLFNEADAIFSKRKDISGGSSVELTENAIQNIILEEMEKLDGIMIATTNLAGNLDKAFERRFLFKIRFDKPTAEAKRNIWMDKLSGLDEADAAILAAEFDFSGGEIENIARKAEMMEILDGRRPSIANIMDLCSEEKLGKPAVSRIGFFRQSER